MNTTDHAAILPRLAVSAIVCMSSLMLISSGARAQAPESHAATPSERAQSAPPVIVDEPTTLVLDENGIPEGYVLIEGDIQVPVEFLTHRGTWVWAQWPGGIVPIIFDDNVTDVNRVQMLNAMAEWETRVNVDFAQHVGQANYVRIRASSGNNSAIGVQGGEQIINIVSWSASDRFIMAHELGHCLGFWHEHSRADRDAYVIINWGDIQAGREDNFDIRSSGDEYGPYDFDSVMHYDACSFSTCCPAGTTCGCPSNCTTIDARPAYAQFQSLMGQRDHLSEWDVRIMSFLYPESNWRFVDSQAAELNIGSFRFPYRTFQNGYTLTPAGGTMWMLRAGTYSTSGTLSKAMTLRSALGVVRLGG